MAAGRDVAINDWSDDGWDERVRAWVDERLAAVGTSATGPVERFRVRAWSCVMRVPTERGPVWFKANTAGSLFEPGLVAALGRWTPDAVLGPLAVDAARGWLLSPDGGKTLQDAEPPSLGRWEEMLRAYAELQRSLSARVGEMLALGVPDLRPSTAGGAFAALLHVPEVRDGLEPGRYVAVSTMEPAYRRWCVELAADGVPASLQHDDLSDANVFHGDGRHRFFDWGDAWIAHPFSSLLIALHVATRRLGVAPGGPELRRLRDAYLEPWTADHDAAHLARSATLAMRVGTVSRALSWQRALRAAPVPVGPEHVGAVAGSIAAVTGDDLVPEP